MYEEHVLKLVYGILGELNRFLNVFFKYILNIII